jgi:ATP-dependent DNA helicase HFM1/MER3
LAEHGITSLDILRKQDPLRIDRVRILYIVILLLTRLQLLNRRSPFGLNVLASVAEFPLYSLSMKETDIFSDGTNPVQVHLLVECGLVDEVSPLIKPKKQNRHAMSITVVLTLTSDMDMIDFRRIPSVIYLHSIYTDTYRRIRRTKALINGKSFEVIAELTKPSQTIIVIITSVSRFLFIFSMYSS